MITALITALSFIEGPDLNYSILPPQDLGALSVGSNTVAGTIWADETFTQMDLWDFADVWGTVVPVNASIESVTLCVDGTDNATFGVHETGNWSDSNLREGQFGEGPCYNVTAPVADELMFFIANDIDQTPTGEIFSYEWTVNVIPVPAAVYLFGSALLLLGFVRGRGDE